MKRFFTFVLAMVMLLPMVPAAHAAQDEALLAADTLYELGLFSGTGTGPDGRPVYELERAPTRHEAVTMLVRLLGKAEEALAGSWNTPFADVADWAKPYVGYAYANGLTSGTGASTFSGEQTVTASQYLTFVLRALGYDSSTDFKWDAAWELSDRIGLTDGRYGPGTETFLRGDVVIVSEAALSARLKGSNVMLLRKLYNQKSAAKHADTAKTIQVSKLGLPTALGGTTLTYEEAYALVGKEPAYIAERVKTVGDVIQYMIAANFGANGRAVHTPWYGDGAWGFDSPGREQILQNYANCCAGNTNLALYLLKGDYEEQGAIRWLGGGNHTINYVKTGGKYYVFDLTFGDFQGPITVLDRLEDYYKEMPGNYPKAEMVNLVALVNTDVCYPWGHVRETALIFPTETREHILQIYKKDESAGISFRNVHIEVPFWNSDKVELLEQVTDDTEHDVYEQLKCEYLGMTGQDRDYSDSELSLLFSNGFRVTENYGFGVGANSSWKIEVQADGSRITEYTVESSDPGVCELSRNGDGSLLAKTKAGGECVWTVTYKGKTAKFFMHIAK